MGVTFVHFHSLGTLPSFIDFVNNKHNGLQSSSESSIKRLELNPSGPGAEKGLSFFNFCLIFSGVKVTDSSIIISGFKCSMFGISFKSSIVNTLEKYAFKFSAINLSSSIITSFTFSGPMLSLLDCLLFKYL